MNEQMDDLRKRLCKQSLRPNDHLFWNLAITISCIQKEVKTETRQGRALCNTDTEPETEKNNMSTEDGAVVTPTFTIQV